MKVIWQGWWKVEENQSVFCKVTLQVQNLVNNKSITPVNSFLLIKLGLNGCLNVYK